MIASHKGYKEIVGLLIEKGASIDEKTYKGSTALMISSIHKKK